MASQPSTDNSIDVEPTEPIERPPESVNVVREGVYYRHLLELFRRTETKILNHCPISSYFPRDLRPPVKELFKEEKQHLSLSMNENFKMFLDKLKLEEKFKVLEESKQKYSSAEKPAWSFSGLPERDCKDISQLSARDMLPQYEDIYRQERTETQRLQQEYHENLTLLNQLKQEAELHLSEIENTLTT